MFQHMRIYDDGNIVLSKKTFVMQNLGIWGIMVSGGKICRRKCHIWNHQPWFAYSLCHFYWGTKTVRWRL